MSDNLLLLILIVSCGILTMLISFFLLFHKSQLKIAEQQRRLHQEKLVHHQNLIKASIASQDLERKRIGRDLHDGIGTSLTILRLSMERFELLHPTNNESQQDFFLDCKTKIDKLISSCRNISHNLSPEILTLNTLSESIEELSSSFHFSDGIHLRADRSVWKHMDKLNEAQAVNIYRILEELLNNTVKHAHAKKVSILFKTQNERLYIHYHDNGIGSNPLNIKNGHGLQHIESRLLVLNGHYENQAVNEMGYSLAFSIPLVYRAEETLVTTVK